MTIKSEHISETTITQPYAPNRCWYGLRWSERVTPINSDCRLIAQRFCGAAATLRRVTRKATYKVSDGRVIEVWLCNKHAVRLETRGYNVVAI